MKTGLSLLNHWIVYWACMTFLTACFNTQILKYLPQSCFHNLPELWDSFLGIKKYEKLWLVVGCACNPSTQETETGGSVWGWHMPHDEQKAWTAHTRPPSKWNPENKSHTAPDSEVYTSTNKVTNCKHKKTNKKPCFISKTWSLTFNSTDRYWTTRLATRT